jgi:arabinofuranosyltransferase
VSPHFGLGLRRREQAALIAGWLLALALMIPLRRYLTDDTFIHLQYARHFAAGQGLVFNVGERVYGCTSPLWAALLGLAMGLHLDGLGAARVFGLFATLASVWLYLQLMRRTLRTPTLRGAATIAWAGHAWMLRWSVSGMETPLAVALVLAGLVAFTDRRPWGARSTLSGTLWSLAALVRPEVAFLLVLWLAFVWRSRESGRDRRWRIVATLPPLLIYGSWLAFAWIYFGTPWPVTLAAKAAGNLGLLDRAALVWREMKIVGATDGIWLLLFAVGAWRSRWRPVVPRRFEPWMVPALWALGLPLLYAARGVPVLSRYLLTTLPMLSWAAWWSAERWWLGAQPEDAASARVRRTGGNAAAVAALALAVNLVVYQVAVLPQVVSFTAGLEHSMVRWGRWFGEHTTEEVVIATPDIGALGYYSQRRVLDLGGLVTPRMIPLLRREPEEDVVAHLAFADFARPEFIVDRADSAYDLMRRSPWAACLQPLGQADLPNLGIARPGRVIYTFYRVDWRRYDDLQPGR